MSKYYRVSLLARIHTFVEAENEEEADEKARNNPIDWGEWDFFDEEEFDVRRITILEYLHRKKTPPSGWKGGDK